MIQGLFDETEDKSQSEEGASKAKTSAFSENVLFEITKIITKEPKPKPPLLQEVEMESAAEPETEPVSENSSNYETEETAEKSEEIVGDIDKVQAEIIMAEPAAEEVEEKIEHQAAEEVEANDEQQVDEVEVEEKIEEPVEEVNGEQSDEIIVEKADQPVEAAAEVEVEAESKEQTDQVVEEETGDTVAEEVEENSTNMVAEEIEETLPLQPDEIISEEKQISEPETEISFSDPNDAFSMPKTPKTDEPELFQAQTKSELPEETSRKTGLALSAGIALFGSVAFMLIIGWFADLLLGTSPWGKVVGIVIGSAIGFLQFFRTTSQILKNDD